MKLIILFLSFLSIGKFTNLDIVNKAIAIQKQYKDKNDKYVVMVDYSKSIDDERLYIVNTKTAQIEMTSIVSHGVNSGKEYATDFSNVKDSKKSSLGAYLTESTYYGIFGYSLHLKGLDKTNNLARERAIIFHSSKGCFYLPEKNTRKIIDVIKGGCLVYAYN